MDRPDELRDDSRETPAREEAHRDQVRREEEPRDEAVRPDGILGIADANPPRDDVPSEGRRVEGVEVDTERPGAREVQRSSGATGIDMGAGGQGTDVDRDI
jgi:hypothetical protein